MVTVPPDVARLHLNCRLPALFSVAPDLIEASLQRLGCIPEVPIGARAAP